METGGESGCLRARVSVMSSSDQEISETAGAETQVIRESFVSGLGGDSGCLCLPGSMSVPVFRRGGRGGDRLEEMVTFACRTRDSR